MRSFKLSPLQIKLTYTTINSQKSLKSILRYEYVIKFLYTTVFLWVSVVVWSPWQHVEGFRDPHPQIIGPLSTQFIVLH
jgi:hypothetical protein